MNTYAVECVDRATGRSLIRSYHAQSADAARDQAASDGFLTGEVVLQADTFHAPAPPRDPATAAEIGALLAQLIGSRTFKVAIEEGVNSGARRALFWFFIWLPVMIIALTIGLLFLLASLAGGLDQLRHRLSGP